MFVPAFFTGHLINASAHAAGDGGGVSLPPAACVAIALTGLELERFLAALLLLGIGWNFHSSPARPRC